MRKIIFLDIDGVLNCENGYKNGYCEYKEMIVDSGEKNHYQQFYPPSKKLINKLIEETGAQVVISSTWRHSGIKFMRNVWKEEGMSGEIIDITPDLFMATTRKDIKYRIPRGCEIDSWLKESSLRVVKWSKEKLEEYMVESDIENYIIIDDDSDMLYKQKDHFVHVLPSPRNKEGFNEENYEQAVGILNKNFIDLYYDDN